MALVAFSNALQGVTFSKIKLSSCARSAAGVEITGTLPVGGTETLSLGLTALVGLLFVAAVLQSGGCRPF